MDSRNLLGAVLERERWVVVVAIAIVIAASWLYILAGAGMGMTAFEMSVAPWEPAMPAMNMGASGAAAWSPAYAILMFFMWWVMMVAMMLPSAAPMILLYARIDRQQRERHGTAAATGVFAGGYLLAWGFFSLVAVLAQWGLEKSELLSPMMMTSTSAALGGGLLVAAGVWQLTPLKHACLKRCRSPVQFLSRHWRPGRGGALRMGVTHGAFCLGCCWFLMALLFYGGVMNLYWIIGLAVYVLAEKLMPAGHWLGYLAGAGLIAWGVSLLAAI